MQMNVDNIILRQVQHNKASVFKIQKKHWRKEGKYGT